METPITYSLRNKETNSELYYQQIREFTDYLLSRAEASLLPIVDEYKEYIEQYHLEDMRTREEYCYELLAFAVLWKTYGDVASQVRWAPYQSLARMAEWRKQNQRWKPIIDLIRGISFTLFLTSSKLNRSMNTVPSLPQVEKLMRWLDATGEFREDAIRFIFWFSWWSTLSSKKIHALFTTVIEFGEWFETESASLFGAYTRNVSQFLATNRSHYRWREDQMSCLRTQTEYHLNMVGAEIMNRAYRKDFAATHQRAVLVPGCMRKRSPSACEARIEQKGLHCTGCEASCSVNRLRMMGGKDGFDVYIIPHASDLRLWAAQPGEAKRGVVGVACLTTLVEGGWELKRYNIPAQCVLLDFCGCQKHWHPRGIPTELNMIELKRKMRV